MANNILIIGESGAGKTTSIRELNPNATTIFDCDKKGLSWRGWKQQYNTEKGNYIPTSDVTIITQYFRWLEKNDEDARKIKVVIIDTLNGIMIDDEMRRSKEKNYDKWIDLASTVYDLIQLANAIKREDLYIVFTGHSETLRDDTGTIWTHLKTGGKKLEKIVLESKFTMVLHAVKKEDAYIFETQSNNSTAKSPMGLFTDMEIPNNLKHVITEYHKYING